MDTKLLLDKVALLVRSHLESSHCGHDVPHAFRVMNLASELIAKHPVAVDCESVLVAALVHDICRPVEKSTGRSHFGPEALAFISTELKSIGMEKNEIEPIIEIVRFHDVYEISKIPNLTEELKIHQDADRLDAIGAIGIARTFAFGGAHGLPLYLPGENLDFVHPFVEDPSHRTSTIAHFYEKLLKLRNQMHTARGRELA